MEKINVIEYTQGLGFCEAGKILYTFCKHLDRSKYDISVCTFRNDKQSDIEQKIRNLGIEVHFLPHGFMELLEFFKSLKANILHIYRNGQTDFGVIYAAKKAGIEVVIEHNIYGLVDTSEENDLIDCHIFTSFINASRYQTLVKHPLLSLKYEILYNPIEIDVFDRFGFGKGNSLKKAIGRVGEANNDKWNLNFLDSLPMVIEKFHDLEFHVMGITPEVFDKIRALGCERNLVLHPVSTSEKDLLTFYSNISLLVHFTSEGESTGLALSEAMAAKLPIVSHYTHDSNAYQSRTQIELIDHGINGFIATNSNVYACAIITLLSSPDVARLMGSNGYNKARACFDAKSIALGLEEIFITHVGRSRKDNKSDTAVDKDNTDFFSKNYILSLYTKYDKEINSNSFSKMKIGPDGEYEGGISHVDGEIIYMIMREFNPVNVIEFSPNNGYSTAFIYTALQKNARHFTFATFDIELHPFFSDRMEELGLSPKLIIGDAIETIPKYIIDSNLNNKIDLCYIDSDHTNEFAKKYTETILPLVNNNCIYIIHDMCYTRLDTSSFTHYGSILPEEIAGTGAARGEGEVLANYFSKRRHFTIFSTHRLFGDCHDYSTDLPRNLELIEILSKSIERFNLPKSAGKEGGLPRPPMLIVIIPTTLLVDYNSKSSLHI